MEPWVDTTGTLVGHARLRHSRIRNCFQRRRQHVKLLLPGHHHGGQATGPDCVFKLTERREFIIAWLR